MTTEQSTPPVARGSGPSLFWAGIALCLLAVALLVIQYSLKHLIDPWYLPALTSLGMILVLASLLHRTTWVRMIMLALVAVLAIFQWYFLLVLARLPGYDGPAQTGRTLPAFQTVRADGRTFTDHDLKDGVDTAVVFFRGRW